MKIIHVSRSLIVLALAGAVIAMAAYSHKTGSGYRVGVMVPLTGASASIGESVKRGVELAVRDITANGGSLAPLFEDDRGDSTTAVTVANRFISTDDIHVIIGPVKSDPLLAIAPITERNKVIVMSPTAGAASITNAGDFVFRNIETPAIHGEADAAFFASRTAGRVAVLIANASNAQGYGNAFIASCMNGCSVVATSTYNQNDQDLRTIIAKSLQRKPSGLYVAVATAQDAGLVVRQTRELGFTGMIMVSVAADAKEFFESAGSAAEGSYVSSPYFDPARDPEITDAFEANAYDATMILFTAMKECGSDSNTPCIRDYLYGIKDYPGAGGSTTFDRNGDVIKPVSIKVAHDGKFVQSR